MSRKLGALEVIRSWLQPVVIAVVVGLLAAVGNGLLTLERHDQQLSEQEESLKRLWYYVIDSQLENGSGP